MWGLPLDCALDPGDNRRGTLTLAGRAGRFVCGSGYVWFIPALVGLGTRYPMPQHRRAKESIRLIARELADPEGAEADRKAARTAAEEAAAEWRRRHEARIAQRKEERDRIEAAEAKRRAAHDETQGRIDATIKLLGADGSVRASASLSGGSVDLTFRGLQVENARALVQLAIERGLILAYP